MLLHQVAFCGHQHRTAKRVQVRVVLLVGHAIDFVRRVHVNVSD